jgi:hypothetical protein
MPIRIVAGYDLFRRFGWRIQAGLPYGLGLFSYCVVISYKAK